MSYAIKDLHLEAPPFTVRKVGSCHAFLWLSDCDRCGSRTQPRRLLSATVDDVHEHQRLHLLWEWERNVEELEAELKAAAA